MKPIFSGNKDIRKSAFLNWRISQYYEIQNMLIIADGFMLSSIELAKLCLEDNSDKKADIIIFPVLTNANHGIELYLKAIQSTLNKIIGIDIKIENTHSIKKVYETVRGQIKVFDGGKYIKRFNQLTVELHKYVIELNERIESTPQKDKMDFSRYPVSKQNESYFYVEEVGNVEIDLENYIVQFTKIKDNLEEISDYLYHVVLNNEEDYFGS